MEINKQEIIKKLSDKGADLSCHRCGKKSFSILDGYSKFTLQKDMDDLPSVIVGGPFVPVILIVCTNCGAITPHAIGALDVLLEGEQKDD